MIATMPSTLTDYINEKQPFGPVDSTVIADPDAFAQIFETTNVPLARLFQGSTVIFGRRGSGKSSLLETYKSDALRKKLLEASKQAWRRLGLPQPIQTIDYDIVLSVDMPASIVAVQKKVDEIGASYVPSEIISNLWDKHIWTLLFGEVKKIASISDNADAADLAIISSFETSGDLKELVSQYFNDQSGSRRPIEFSEAKAAMRRIVQRGRKNTIVLFDTVEDIALHKEAFRDTITGLLRFIGRFASTTGVAIDFKVCLPTELHDELFERSSNPGKDFHRKQFVMWSATELWRVVAHRFRLFLEVFDPLEWTNVRDLNLNTHIELRKFWSRYLPETIENGMGEREDVLRYILRHTQMLPRQLITIMNQIATTSLAETGTFVPFSESVIRRSVRAVERDLCREIFSVFSSVYPEISRAVEATLQELPRTFDIKTLRKVWSQGAKARMYEMNIKHFDEFVRMLLRIGCLGVVDQERAEGRYIYAQFEFNSLDFLHLGASPLLCVHPIYSGSFKTKMAGNKNAVFPLGTELIDGATPKA